MHIIDADTHIDETEDTWAYLREEELQFKPTTNAICPPSIHQNPALGIG